MRIPKRKDYPTIVYLRGEAYKLIFVKNYKDYGLTDSGKRVIIIRDGMSDNETFKTFIHEILHFFEFEWPIKGLKHKVIRKLEKAFFAFVVDNFI